MLGKIQSEQVTKTVKTSHCSPVLSPDNSYENTKIEKSLYIVRLRGFE